jgi:hypothetical protein
VRHSLPDRGPRIRCGATGASVHTDSRAFLAASWLRSRGVHPPLVPRILDPARAENLSLTAVLERLLEIEVNATEERRLACRPRFACLPDPGSSRTSTSPPSPASTRNSSATWPPCGFSTILATTGITTR